MGNNRLFGWFHHRRPKHWTTKSSCLSLLIMAMLLYTTHGCAAEPPAQPVQHQAVAKTLKNPKLSASKITKAKQDILAQAKPNGMIEGLGLLIDETRSMAGHNFITLFIQNFNEVLGERSTITVTERVDPIRGSFIIISVDDALVFQAPLNPRQDAVEELAVNAVAVISEFIVNLYAAPTDVH